MPLTVWNKLRARSADTSSQGNYLATLDTAWAKHLAPRSQDAPTVISTFAGCGGSSLGYSIAGFKELLAVEWDAHAVECLRANFPGLDVYHGDIHDLTVDEILRRTGLKPGQLTVFDGSWPCQGFSTAGSRIFDDERNQLFREFVRLLRGLRPVAFVGENVSGLVKGKMRLIFADTLREMKASGYRVSARLLDSAYFGVAQHRQRIVFVGIRDDLGIEPSHPKAQTRLITVGDAIGDLPLDEQRADICHEWIDESPNGRNTKTWHLADKAKQGERYAGQHKRLQWDEPAATLTTGGVVSGYLRAVDCHPRATRVFSLREAARLNSFHEPVHLAGGIQIGAAEDREFRFRRCLWRGLQDTCGNWGRVLGWLCILDPAQCF